MDQRELKKLLVEASKPNCSGERINEIHVLLSRASVAMRNGQYAADGQEAGILLVLDKLFVDTVDNRQHLLPTLFPVFALLCGDRQRDRYCADVDWSLA